MKIQRFFSTLFYFFFSISLIGQTNVNKYILDQFGTPSPEIEWAANTRDLNNNLFTAGNTIISFEQVAILITKQLPSGQIAWQTTWQASNVGISKNYGVAIHADNLGNIFVAGVTTSSNDADSLDYVILKYDTNGLELWSKTINGIGNKADIPTALTTDLQNNIIVTGVSTGIDTGEDYLTLKLNKDNGNTLWEERYDDAGLYDNAVDVKIDDAGNPVVTGSSSSDILDRNFKTIQYKGTDGTILNDNTIDIPGNGFEIPKAIAKDGNGNFYITGDADLTGQNKNIQTIKLDENLNEIWSVTYDGNGMDDEAFSLQVGNNGMVYITGYSKNNNGQKELLVLAYDANGNLDWEQRRKPENQTLEVIGKRSTLSDDGFLYVAGEIIGNGTSIIVINKFSLDGKKIWEQRHSEGNDKVTGIVKSDKGLFVFVQLGDGANGKYYTLLFDEYRTDNPIIYDNNTGLPVNKANELIVKFNAQDLKIDNIDNLNLTFGLAEQWINDDALLKLGTRVDLRDATFIRIFKTLKSTHLTSISRLQETIPIPDFYATFVIDFPSGTDLDNVILNMGPLFPTVKYAHLNYVATLSDVPNDPLYEDQKSLQNPNSAVANDINIEPFWEKVTGKPFVKIGVLDSGLDLSHEDFALSDQTSVAVDGWDYVTNAFLSTLNDSDQDAGGHGTRSAGIIGAIRNNDLGIAGIAGGFWDGGNNPSDRGVSLYGIKIHDGFTPDMATASDAIVCSSTDDPNIDNAFGVHVLNASWNVTTTSLDNSEVQLLGDAIHFANRNKVSFINASGNWGNWILDVVECSYPACLDGDWITVVSGTGTDGNYKIFTNGTPDDFYPNKGPHVDIAAPCVEELVWTTQGIDEPDNYLDWNGTSAAAPHAAGVAGLLLSYLNTPTPSYNNLAPEDIEFVMKETATATNQPDFPIPNNLTGYGRVNAGASFSLIQQPFRSLVHFGTDNDPNNKSSNLVDSDITINLTEPYDNAMGQSFNIGTYTADAYRINATVNHTILPTDLILHSWERHSSSTLFPLAVDGGDLIPHEKVNLTAVSDNQALLEGYVYELKDGSGNSLGWVPFEVTDLNSAELCYSLIIEDQISTSIDNIDNSFSLDVLPNPTSDLVEINISNVESMAIDVQLIDVFGREVLKIHSGEIHHSLIKSVDLSALTNGLYYVVTTTDKDKIIRPVVKQ